MLHECARTIDHVEKYLVVCGIAALSPSHFHRTPHLIRCSSSSRRVVNTATLTLARKWTMTRNSHYYTTYRRHRGVETRDTCVSSNGYFFPFPFHFFFCFAEQLLTIRYVYGSLDESTTTVNDYRDQHHTMPCLWEP